jgi:hypothetical protein
MNTEEKFFNRIKKQSAGCWEWQGALTKAGYGLLGYQGKMEYAHRLSYKLIKGTINDGQCVCHSCDNPKCCNPEHLWLGSKKENNMDKARKGRAKNGNLFTTNNPMKDPMIVQKMVEKRTHNKLMKDMKQK